MAISGEARQERARILVDEHHGTVGWFQQLIRDRLVQVIVGVVLNVLVIGLTGFLYGRVLAANQGLYNGFLAAEVEELVEPGEIDPDHVHLPGIYVQRVVPLTPEQAADKRIEKRTVRDESKEA